MGDLDELAHVTEEAAARAAAPPGRVRLMEETEDGTLVDAAIAARCPPMVPMWVWLAAVGVLGSVLLIAYWVINMDTPPGGVAPSATKTEQQEDQPSAPPLKKRKAPIILTAPPPRRDARAATGPATRRVVLEDIADPVQALEILHLKRGEGDTVEIKARNRSRRGLFVRRIELLSKSDPRGPLAELGFWLEPGAMLQQPMEFPGLSVALGKNGEITAVVRQAEYRDKMPKELSDR